MGLIFGIAITLAGLLAMTAPAAYAQGVDTSTQHVSEDIEPRTIGVAGTTMIGLGGYIDRFFSPDEAMPTNYTAEIDLGRFVTRSIVLHGGLSGSGSIGGEDADDLSSGAGAAALHAFGGGLYYFTPQSIASLYTGGEYWGQLTRRAEGDRGSIVAKFGLQGAISSRVSLFLEGGYGIGLTRDDDGDRLTRIVGRFGVRLKF